MFPLDTNGVSLSPCGSDESTCCQINFLLPCIEQLQHRIDGFRIVVFECTDMLEKVVHIFWNELVPGEPVHLIVQEHIRVVCAVQFDVLDILTGVRQFSVQPLNGFELQAVFVVVQVMKKGW